MYYVSNLSLSLNYSDIILSVLYWFFNLRPNLPFPRLNGNILFELKQEWKKNFFLDYFIKLVQKFSSLNESLFFGGINLVKTEDKFN